MLKVSLSFVKSAMRAVIASQWSLDERPNNKLLLGESYWLLNAYLFCPTMFYFLSCPQHPPFAEEHLSCTLVIHCHIINHPRTLCLTMWRSIFHDSMGWLNLHQQFFCSMWYRWWSSMPLHLAWTLSWARTAKKTSLRWQAVSRCWALAGALALFLHGTDGLPHSMAAEFQKRGSSCAPHQSKSRGQPRLNRRRDRIHLLM